MPEPAHLLVLTTLPSSFDIPSLAATLVGEHLAACVNVTGEMQSTYWWNGAIERDRERQIFIKTTADRFEALRARLGQLHPYELPEIIAIPIAAGSDAYLGWMVSATRPEGGR